MSKNMTDPTKSMLVLIMRPSNMTICGQRKAVFKEVELIGKIKVENYFRDISHNIHALKEHRTFNIPGYLMNLVAA